MKGKRKKTKLDFSKKYKDRELRKRALEQGGAESPAKVNVFKTSNKATYGTSGNFDLFGESEKPKNINFETNEPLAIKSKNQKALSKKEVIDDGYAVNGKIVKANKTVIEQEEYFPIIKSTTKRKRKKK